MKKVFLLLALATLSVTSYAQFGGSGSGTATDPYLVATDDDLFDVRNDLTACYKMVADIDLTTFIQEDNPTSGWTPIGTAAKPFKGTFDGNGHVIRGLYINRPGEAGVGLFGVTDGATLQNVTLISPTVTGGNSTGAFIGNAATGYIIDKVCIVNPTVTGGQNVGGLIGRAYATTTPRMAITNNVVAGGHVTGTTLVGGLAGLLQGTSNMYYQGTYGDRYVTYSCNYNFASPTINATNTAGGIIATAKGVYCQETSSSIRYDGYVIPTLWGNHFAGCIMTANTVGGILGALDGTGKIVDKNGYSYTTNVTKNADNARVSVNMAYNLAGGEIIGTKACGVWHTFRNGNNYTKANSPTGYMQKVTLSNNVFYASKLSSESSIPYRISLIEKGDNFAAATGSTVIYNGEEITPEDDYYNGTSVGLRQLKRKNTYVGMGFDFDTQWAIVEGKSFPYNINQSTPAEVTNYKSGSSAKIEGTADGNGKVFVFVDDKMLEGIVNGGAWSVNLGFVKPGTKATVHVATEGKMASIGTIAYADGLTPSGETDDTDEVTLSAQYGTYCSVDNLDFSNVEGVKAYVATGYQGDALYLMNIDVVPAGTGIILKGTPGTYKISHTTQTGVFTNLLKGVTEATTIQATEGSYTNFILANGSSGIGFYPLSAAGELAANKAYLTLPTSALNGSQTRMKLTFDDGSTTGIESISKQSVEADAFYTISGVRLQGRPAQKGVFIHNGKKIIVK
ncbi:MAG: hypothetical protein J6N92_01420 [Alloprevotella sp.]|nr:hypothetical protein [Alloprevotella sp.]